MTCLHEHDFEPGTAYAAVECTEHDCEAWKTWPHEHVTEILRDVTGPADWEPREIVTRVNLWWFNADAQPVYFDPINERALECDEVEEHVS